MNVTIEFTFITVAHRVEVHVIVVVPKEQETQPGFECVDRHDEKDSNDPPLFSRVRIPPEVLIDLNEKKKNCKKSARAIFGRIAIYRRGARRLYLVARNKNGSPSAGAGYPLTGRVLQNRAVEFVNGVGR